MEDPRHDIEKYLRGELTSAQMHALEKEALNDPFLAEALEGIEQAGPDDFLYDLHKLNRSVHARTHKRKNKTLKLWGWTTGMAAAVVFVAVCGFLVISLLQEESARRQAMVDTPPPWDQLPVDTLTVVLPREAAPEATAENPSAPALPPRAAIADAGILSEEEVRGEDRQPPSDRSADSIRAAAERLEIADARQREEEAVSKSSVAESERAADVDRSDRLQRRAAGVAEERSPSTVANRINGSVKTPDGEALPGVNVSVSGTDIRTLTDANGNFEITVPSAESTLVFNFVGFEPHQVPDAGKVNEAIDVIMKEDMTTLSEVVVTGYGSEGPASEPSGTYSPATPAGGRAAFRKYLSEAVEYPAEAIKAKTEGRVTVRFTVQPDGVLTDFEVVKGIGSGCEEELIRAIREGPAWEPSRRGETRLVDTVRVRFRFGLP